MDKTIKLLHLNALNFKIVKTKMEEIAKKELTDNQAIGVLLIEYNNLRKRVRQKELKLFNALPEEERRKKREGNK